MNVIDWLIEPGTTRLAVAVFWGFVAFVAVCVLVGFAPSMRRRQETDEQIINPSRPASSTRKSGRVRS